MSVAESTARLMKMPDGTPRVRRMPRTGTGGPAAGAGAPDGTVRARCSRRQREAYETAATAPETSRAVALVGAIRPSCSEMTSPAATGPISRPREAPMVKWPKLRSRSSGALRRATIDWAPMTKQRCPSQLRSSRGDPNPQGEGPVGDGRPGHTHRSLREGEGEDQAQQPSPAGPPGVGGGHAGRAPQRMPKSTPAHRTTREVSAAHLTVNLVWSPNSTLAMPTRT